MWEHLTSLEDKAEYIIENNKYMVLATADKKARPWGAVVLYVRDKRYNFYFLSAIDSLHVKNVLSNETVSFVIFDSSQPISSSDSVQGIGNVSAIEKGEIKEIIEMYSQKVFPDSDVPANKRYPSENFLPPAEFRFFKIMPEHIYVNGPDRRGEVDLRSYS